MVALTIGDGFIGTFGCTVEAHHTARCVDEMRRQVDAVGLAHMDTAVAIGAQVGVDVHMKEGICRRQ